MDESDRPLTSVSHENIASPRFPGDITNVDTARDEGGRTLRGVIRRSKSLPNHAGFRGIREQTIDEKKSEFNEDQEDQLASKQNASADLRARCRRINAETLSSGEEFVLAESLGNVLSSRAKCVLCDLVVKVVQISCPELFTSPLTASAVIESWARDALVHGRTVGFVKRKASDPEERYNIVFLRVSYLAGTRRRQCCLGLSGARWESIQRSNGAPLWRENCSATVNTGTNGLKMKREDLSLHSSPIRLIRQPLGLRGW